MTFFATIFGVIDKPMQLFSLFKLEILLATFAIGAFCGLAKDQVTAFVKTDQSLEQTILVDNTPPKCNRIKVAQAPL